MVLSLMVMPFFMGDNQTAPLSERVDRVVKEGWLSFT
jgi:hypothetical protein